MAKTYEIYPSIGIARVAPSSDFYFGPEPDGTFPPSVSFDGGGVPHGMRDATGRLRPQAARFRVYEVERTGAELTSFREITSAEADITWQVHVVNRKAAAPRFAVNGKRNMDPSRRRNGAANSDDLNNPTNAPLIINPGKQSVGTGAAAAVDCDGQIQGFVVHLGAISVEGGTGRLIFVGGEGNADTFPASGGALSTTPGDFADNDGWFDDTADGTVEATLTFRADGRVVNDVRPAWVVSGAYDFAPEVTNLVTIYDILMEMAVDNGLRKLPSDIVYDLDIRPLFERLSGYQWVNQGARNFHGNNHPKDFLHNATLGDLSSVAGQTDRVDIFQHLRKPGTANAPNATQMPLLHSDNFPNDNSVLWLTKVQYELLRQWSSNNFKVVPSAPRPAELLPDALTRMQLQSCVGRAFWPGIEISMRIYDPTIFYPDDPFRIKLGGAVEPGMLTQSMSIPWQSDFLDCAEEPNAAGTTLYWWPAQRPNKTLRSGGTAAMVDWRGSIADGKDMTQRWHQLGVVRTVGPGATQKEIERLIP